MKTEHLAQERVLDVARHQPVNRLVRTQPDQVRRHPHHVGEGREGPVGQVDKRPVEDRARFADELQVARHILGVEAPDLLDHRGLVAGVIEHTPIVKNDAVKRRHRHDRHIILRPPPRQREELVDEERRGDDRGARVVGEAAVLEDVGAAARLVAHLQHRRLIAARAQADRRRQPAKPRADDQCATGKGRRGVHDRPS